MASLRHRVRIAALQILFEVDLTDHSPGVVLERRLNEEDLPLDGARFLQRLVFGVWEHRPYLDRIIEELRQTGQCCKCRALIRRFCALRCLNCC